MANSNSTGAYTDPLINSTSMATSFAGTPSNIQNYANVYIQLVWTGSNPIGTITVQCSADYDPRTNTGTWCSLQNTPGTPISIIPNGVAGNGVFDLNQIPGNWIQVIYTTAGGSVGNLTSKVVLKGLN